MKNCKLSNVDGNIEGSIVEWLKEGRKKVKKPRKVTGANREIGD